MAEDAPPEGAARSASTATPRSGGAAGGVPKLIKRSSSMSKIGVAPAPNDQPAPTPGDVPTIPGLTPRAELPTIPVITPRTLEQPSSLKTVAPPGATVRRSATLSQEQTPPGEPRSASTATPRAGVPKLIKRSSSMGKITVAPPPSDQPAPSPRDVPTIPGLTPRGELPTIPVVTPRGQPSSSEEATPAAGKKTTPSSQAAATKGSRR